MSKKDRCTSVALPPQGQRPVVRPPWPCRRLHVLAGGFDAHSSQGTPEPGARLGSTPCPTRPASSRAVPGRSSGCRRAGAGRAYEPPPEKVAAADPAIAELGRPRLARARRRGRPAGRASPSSMTALDLELEEMRWALRLLATDASGALSVLCVVRDHEGRWLAGRRAAWVASWAGRVGARRRRRGRRGRGSRRARSAASLQEEWAVEPERIAVEALIATPGGHDDARSARPGWRRAPRSPATTSTTRTRGGRANPSDWPEEAHPQLRRLATLLAKKLRELPHPQVPVLHATRPSTPPCWSLAITGAADDVEVRARVGARHRLDRHVAAVHRRRPPARDPALAGRDGRRRRRRRAVCGHHRFRVCRTACKTCRRTSPQRDMV